MSAVILFPSLSRKRVIAISSYPNPKDIFHLFVNSERKSHDTQTKAIHATRHQASKMDKTLTSILKKSAPGQNQALRADATAEWLRPSKVNHQKIYYVQKKGKVRHKKTRRHEKQLKRPNHQHLLKIQSSSHY